MGGTLNYSRVLIRDYGGQTEVTQCFSSAERINNKKVIPKATTKKINILKNSIAKSKWNSKMFKLPKGR